MKWPVVLLSVLAVLVTACAGARSDSQASGEPGGTSQAPPRQVRATSGQELFMGNCAKCHGPGGLGDGPSAGSLRTQSGLNLTILKDKSDEEILTTISAGRGTEMPPFELILAPEQRRELVKYIRGLEKK